MDKTQEEIEITQDMLLRTAAFHYIGKLKRGDPLMRFAQRYCDTFAGVSGTSKDHPDFAAALAKVKSDVDKLAGITPVEPMVVDTPAVAESVEPVESPKTHMGRRRRS